MADISKRYGRPKLRKLMEISCRFESFISRPTVVDCDVLWRIRWKVFAGILIKKQSVFKYPQYYYIFQIVIVDAIINVGYSGKLFIRVC